MKTRFITFACAVFLIVCVSEISAQGTAKTNEWRGLKLGVSTSSDAIGLFGKPTADRLRQKYRPMKFDEWFDVGTADFRVFVYEGGRALRGFKSVRLFFRDDFLMVIRLKPRKMKALALERAYDSEFEYVPDRFSEIFLPGDYGRRRKGPNRPKNYPMFYYLLNETNESYALAAIDNNSVREVFGDPRYSRGGVPGSVNTLDLISTKLESDDGSDLLK
ncbi:MAG: hypothetical protein HKN25_07930 [Pyrinomonadaceae bacterium]|nr:hypothetical protein [Pyrinomonadaceae bacterium]